MLGVQVDVQQLSCNTDLQPTTMANAATIYFQRMEKKVKNTNRMCLLTQHPPPKLLHCWNLQMTFCKYFLLSIPSPLIRLQKCLFYLIMAVKLSLSFFPIFFFRKDAFDLTTWNLASDEKTKWAPLKTFRMCRVQLKGLAGLRKSCRLTTTQLICRHHADFSMCHSLLRVKSHEQSQYQEASS